jgi:predicted enzyme related to lactoylglutathione lyase
VEVLSSRTLVHAPDLAESVRWYREVLGLRVAREYGHSGQITGVVFFLGGGFLEVLATSGVVSSQGVTLWLQVHDVDSEHRRLAAAGANIVRRPRTEPWGLRECWIDGPDQASIVLVEVPETHPLRRRVEL